VDFAETRARVQRALGEPVDQAPLRRLVALYTESQRAKAEELRALAHVGVLCATQQTSGVPGPIMEPRASPLQMNEEAAATLMQHREELLATPIPRREEHPATPTPSREEPAANLVLLEDKPAVTMQPREEPAEVLTQSRRESVATATPPTEDMTVILTKPRETPAVTPTQSRFELIVTPRLTESCTPVRMEGVLERVPPQLIGGSETQKDQANSAGIKLEGALECTKSALKPMMQHNRACPLVVASVVSFATPPPSCLPTDVATCMAVQHAKCSQPLQWPSTRASSMFAEPHQSPIVDGIELPAHPILLRSPESRSVSEAVPAGTHRSTCSILPCLKSPRNAANGKDFDQAAETGCNSETKVQQADLSVCNTSPAVGSISLDGGEETFPPPPNVGICRPQLRQCLDASVECLDLPDQDGQLYSKLQNCHWTWQGESRGARGPELPTNSAPIKRLRSGSEMAPSKRLHVHSDAGADAAVTPAVAARPKPTPSPGRVTFSAHVVQLGPCSSDESLGRADMCAPVSSVYAAKLEMLNIDVADLGTLSLPHSMSFLACTLGVLSPMYPMYAHTIFGSIFSKALILYRHPVLDVTKLEDTVLRHDLSHLFT
jgi:hypothetical protein